jgi:16S rRNA processing protein RimM
MIKKESICKIGAFTKPHGIKGEISFVAQGLPGISDNEFVICDIDGICIPFFIEAVRSKTQATWLVKLAAVDSEEAVRRLLGKEVFCPAEAFPEDEHGVEGWHGLEGYSISDREGRSLGVISDVNDSTINTLLIVDGPYGELLIPAVSEWVIGTDVVGRQITVDIPDGLLTI